jgi:vacuolar protein sorting-associated protein 51
MASSDDDNSSSSNRSGDDSDDEFLTVDGADREAIVRKKLLESFYGKTAITLDEPSSQQSSRRSHNRSNRDDDGGADGGIEDLDSPNFNGRQHSMNQIRSSTTDALLEYEEELALQVRTLDSTMQTLVYENYSRFIDATDAIRSIGVNVQANESGLRDLTSTMDRVSETSRVIEDALGCLRDQVAEKIRVQRLLSRLDSLLKLPATLQEQIQVGKYKAATKSYLAAASILAKHSEGFESLKSIETECFAILEDLKGNLVLTINHWSGRGITNNGEGLDDEDIDQDAPDPPLTMREIFEVAGTLFILLQQQQFEIPSSEELCSMAVAAAIRLLYRILDVHLIQVQERRFSTELPPSSNPDLSSIMHTQRQEKLPRDGSALIPLDVLDAILEGTTLFTKTFQITGSKGENEDCGYQYYLLEFVSDGFSCFMSHIRSILLEESVQASCEDAEGVDDSEITQKEIAGALHMLVQNVKDLANGLLGVGIHLEFAEKLVNQASDLMNSLVRRRVDHKFHDLRLAVVRHCLLPFTTRAVQGRERALADNKPTLPQITKMATITLSDCLQLVDDAIRSIFTESSASPDDISEQKDAVHSSTFLFASWLANAFEILAGGDCTDSKYLVEATFIDAEHTKVNDIEESGMEGFDVNTESGSGVEHAEDFADREVFALMKEAHKHLLEGSDDESLHSDFILAIVELCRLSQGSVPDNLEQSFTSHFGSGKKKSRGIFPTGASSNKSQKEDNDISKRFKLAASRVLVMYATERGMNAAAVLCNDLADEAIKSGEEVTNDPSISTLAVLAMAKDAVIECSAIFGGSKRGGPVPEWEEDSLGLSSAAFIGRKTGLRLDVERMFKEKVTIYPDPSREVNQSANFVVYLFFKIVFRALFEISRLQTFSSGGYRQMQINAVFLKHMIPHYVNESYTEEGMNACSALATLLGDAMDVFDDRCADDSCASDERLQQDTRKAVGSFISSLDHSSLAEQFLIKEDEK